MIVEKKIVSSGKVIHAGLGGPKLILIPRELTFKLYSKLTEADKSEDLRKLMVEFNQYFSRSGKVGDTWVDIDQELSMFKGIRRRDVLIANWRGRPVGVQQYGMRPRSEVAYEEGTYVLGDCRGHDIAPITREVLYEYLRGEGIRRFNVGAGRLQSALVQTNRQAQRLAEKDVEDHSNALIRVVRSKRDGSIKGYSMDLTRFTPAWDISSVKIE